MELEQVHASTETSAALFDSCQDIFRGDAGIDWFEDAPFGGSVYLGLDCRGQPVAEVAID